MYGHRCHFRHEFRSFQKIHRHFYMCHLAALRVSSKEIIDESKAMPDGSDELELNFQKDMLEQSFEECAPSDDYQCNGQR